MSEKNDKQRTAALIAEKIYRRKMQCPLCHCRCVLISNDFPLYRFDHLKKCPISPHFDWSASHDPSPRRAGAGARASTITSTPRYFVRQIRILRARQFRGLYRYSISCPSRSRCVCEAELWISSEDELEGGLNEHQLCPIEVHCCYCDKKRERLASLRQAAGEGNRE